MLKDSHQANRESYCRKLCRNHKSEANGKFVVSFDKELLNLLDVRGTRKNCYTKKRYQGEKFDCESRESWLKSLWLFKYCDTGAHPLTKIPNNVKMYPAYFVGQVLKPCWSILCHPLTRKTLSIFPCTLMRPRVMHRGSQHRMPIR